MSLVESAGAGLICLAQQTLTPALKVLMMQPAPVVRTGIRALQAGHSSVALGWANKALMNIGHHFSPKPTYTKELTP